MYENQYIVFNEEIDVAFPDFKSFAFETLVVKAHKRLAVTIESGDRASLCILGYIFDPEDPSRGNNDICRELSQADGTIEDFLRMIDRYSGRFCILIRRDCGLYAIPDACALRRIYYSYSFECVALSSAPKLILDIFDEQPKIGPEKRLLIESKKFLQEESPWYGDGYYDDRIHKVLPNHYLNIGSRCVKRIPFYKKKDYQTETMILRDVHAAIQGSIVAASNRYRLIQALTSGLESRFLLACSRPVSEHIKYFVFQQGISKKHPDVAIPNRLAEKLGVDFQVFVPTGLMDEFETRYDREHIFPRKLQKTCNIQYHYEHHKKNNVMNINGNGGGIIKCNYGHKFNVSFASIRSLSNLPNNSFVDGQLMKWYREVEFLKKKSPITMLDAFYWEQRMGQWGGQFPAEQDIAIEEFSPLNNRRMLLAILEIDNARRCPPRYTFFRDLIRLSWPEVLSEPINPSWQVKDIVGKAARRVYLSYVLKKK